MLRRLLFCSAALLWAATPAAAQSAGSFTVSPRIGYMRYETASALKSAGVIGIDAVYFLTPNIGLGFTVDVGRPGTDSSFFPAEMSFGDTTFVFAVQQPVTVVNFQAQLELTMRGQIAPYLRGGVGGYNLTLDPQVAAGQTNLRELGFSIGAGVALAPTAATAIRIEARDFVFTNFDREVLYPVESRLRPTRFPLVVAPQPPFEGTTHNLLFSVSFSFTPGGRQ